MHRCGHAAILAGLALSVGLLAVAPPSNAALVPFTGTFSMRVMSAPPVVVAASGTLDVNGSGGAPSLNSLSLAAGSFETTGQVVAVTTPALSPIAGQKLTMGNEAGTFEGSPLGGTLPLLGRFRVCLYAACDDDYNISNLSVPLSIVGRDATRLVIGGVLMTIKGAPWTTGTAAIGSATAMGFVASAGGGTGHTATQGGHIRLVTPTFVQTNLGAFQLIPMMGVLDIHFVPEPGTIALLGGGVAALACVGLRRR